MSKGGPLSEPLSGLVVYVYLGQPLVPRWQSLPPRCAARREKSARWEKLHHAAAAVSPAASAPPLWEKLAPIRQHACAPHDGAPTERSVASNRHVVGGFDAIATDP